MPKDLDLVLMARQFVESDLRMTIMCGSLNTLEERLRDTIYRSAELLEKAVRYEMEQRRGKKDATTGG